MKSSCHSLSSTTAACTLSSDDETSPKRQVTLRDFFGVAKKQRCDFSNNRKRLHFGKSRAIGANENKTSKKAKSTKASSNLEQMYLDFGQTVQKQVTCPTCGMMYDFLGVQDDLRQHEAVCQHYKEGVPFAAKNARVVVGPQQDHSSSGGRIVEIRPSDSYTLRKKVERVQTIVNRDLGFAHSSSFEKQDTTCTSYLYIVDKRVVGFLVVQSITRAFPVDDSKHQQKSSQKPALMGIYQLWVHAQFRRRGIARRLVTAARGSFVFGWVVPVTQVAFSSPTESGFAFARGYVEDGPVLVYKEEDVSIAK